MEPKTIFVTNINYKSTKKELTEFFSKYAEVKFCRILTTRYRGKVYSRGIGFVEFKEEEGFKAVMKAYQDAKEEGLQFANRKLRISQAKARQQPKKDAVFVGGIPEGTTAEDLKEAFKGFNPTDAKIVRFNTDGNFGFAFVKFEKPEEREKAVKELPKIQLKGEESIVRVSRHDYDFKRKPILRRFNRRAAKQQVNTK